MTTLLLTAVDLTTTMASTCPSLKVRVTAGPDDPAAVFFAEVVRPARWLKPLQGNGPLVARWERFLTPENVPKRGSKDWSHRGFGWVEDRDARTGAITWYTPRLRRAVGDFAQEFFEDALNPSQGSSSERDIRGALSVVEAQLVLRQREFIAFQELTARVYQVVSDPWWTYRSAEGEQKFGKLTPRERLEVIEDHMRDERKLGDMVEESRELYCKLCNLCDQPYWWNRGETRGEMPALLLTKEFQV